MASFLTLFLIIQITIVMFQLPKYSTSSHQKLLNHAFHPAIPIVSSYFKNCVTFIVTDTPKIEEHIQDLNPLFDQQLIHLLTLQPNPSKNTTSHYYPIPNKYLTCSIIITILEEGTKHLSQFHTQITPDFRAMTQREMDHYIFISHEKFTNNLLSSTELQKIKYKLILPIKTVNYYSKTGTTLCFYCNHGSSKLININVRKSFRKADIFPDFTGNGFGHPLRLTVPTKYPFVVELEQIKIDEWRIKRGIYKPVLEVLSSHFNFTYFISPSTGGDSGTHHPNGSWTGVMGDLYSNKADLGVGCVYSLSRYPFASFSGGIRYVWLTFMVGQPKQSYSWKVMFWPFRFHLWISILVSLLSIIVVFKLISRYENLMSKSGKKFPLTAEHLTFTLVGNNVPYPEAPVARFLLVVWLFASLIINTLYVSKLVGLLVFPVKHVQPKTFKELVDKPNFHFRYGLDSSKGAMYGYFKESTNPTIQKVFEEREPSKPIIECLQQAVKENFACISWRGNAEYIAYKNLSLIQGKSPLIAADEDKIMIVPLGLSFPKNSVLLPNINKFIGLLFDSGQGSKWTMDDLEELQRNKVQWQKEVMSNNRKKGWKDERGNYRQRKSGVSLSTRHLHGPFYMYVVGKCGAFLAFMGETFFWTYMRIKNEVST
ncbi:unnamed protein product [Orchesella dallaii]|uniref:Ionotropic glutamate receptor L-glutamate and glycine-binding domain-containing protein n=1 Tax=Orchesella dallaii TaxID=48710 RepID=A0ABP1QHP9_9HEXA